MEIPRKHPRILVVDDDTEHRRLICDTLAIHYRSGRQKNIVPATSAAECIAADPGSFDIILLAYHLPDMGGLALLEQILGMADVPIIFVTSENNTSKAAEAIERGATDYLVKMGDYIFAIPAVVKKALIQHHMRRENIELQNKLQATCEQLRIKNFQLEESLDRLKDMAETDHLTGLHNRRSFADALTRSFSEATRYGFDLTCCMSDLDHYKQINDTLGHQIGDEILQITAEIIRNSLRTSDIGARYGGDEMVLLLPHTDLSHGRAVVERIAEQLAQRTANHPVLNHAVTMSIGVASLSRHHPTSGDALVSMADRALYVAKELGKNRVATFDEVHAHRAL
ncbi:MAG: diguanylate cyclase [Phycisphaerae bacterium]